jgi:outer membrane protein OmpA-like peptidoglycan-associated protein
MSIKSAPVWLTAASLFVLPLSAQAAPYDPHGALALDAPPSQTKAVKKAVPKPRVKNRAITAEPRPARKNRPGIKNNADKKIVLKAKPRPDPTAIPDRQLAHKPPPNKRYTIDEIKRSHQVRRQVRGIDINAVIFAYDSTRIHNWRHPALRRAADRISRALARRPYELFLIEGHTDAVGRPDYNQILSEDRARAVKQVLVEYYGIPPQALETAGYGERYLKIKVDTAEPANRRVTVRRITRLVRRRWRGPVYGSYETPPPPQPHWFWDSRRPYPPPPPWWR